MLAAHKAFFLKVNFKKKSQTVQTLVFQRFSFISDNISGSLILNFLLKRKQKYLPLSRKNEGENRWCIQNCV